MFYFWQDIFLTFQVHYKRTTINICLLQKDKMINIAK